MELATGSLYPGGSAPPDCVIGLIGVKSQTVFPTTSAFTALCTSECNLMTVVYRLAFVWQSLTCLFKKKKKKIFLLSLHQDVFSSIKYFNLVSSMFLFYLSNPVHLQVVKTVGPLVGPKYSYLN